MSVNGLRVLRSFLALTAGVTLFASVGFNNLAEGKAAAYRKNVNSTPLEDSGEENELASRGIEPRARTLSLTEIAEIGSFQTPVRHYPA